MRVNSRVFTERTNLLGGIQILNCPSQFRGVAEQLMMLLTKPGYSVGDYHNVTHLDKLLTLDYWKEYDGLSQAISANKFEDWFISTATSPDLLTRARRWLVERNYLFLKESVAQHAHEAGEKFSKAVRH